MEPSCDCPNCGVLAEVVIIPNDPAIWGTDGITRHGRHTVEIEDMHFKCPECGEEWYDWDLCQRRERLMYEALTPKLGFDPRFENRPPRRRRKNVQG